MSLFTMTKLPDWYFVSLINSEFISLYVDNFINNTSHFQINDARQLPIIIPSKQELSIVERLFKEAVALKKNDSDLPDNCLKVEKNQRVLDQIVLKLYSI